MNRVVPDAEFDAAVDEWARKLASKSPVLMKLGKDAMYRQLDMPFEDALDFLRSQLSLAFTTEDIQEGVTAFFEKRDPMDGPLTRGRLAHSAPLPHGRPLRGRRRRRGVLAPLLGKRARGGAALHRERRRDPRDALRRGPGRGTRLPARGRRPGGGRARGGRTPVLLAGDCSVSATTLPAALRNGPRRACSGSTRTATTTRPDTSGSGYLGGMCLAAATASGTPGSARRCPPSGSCSRGSGTSTPASASCSSEAPATVIGASTVETLVAVKNALDGAPVFVHFDTDIIDPEHFPAAVPAPGGLHPESCTT